MSYGGSLSYLGHKGWKGWTDGEETVFIFDEAQTTYEDKELWFKNLGDHKTLRKLRKSDVPCPRRKFISLVRKEQRVTLKVIMIPVIHHNDHLPAIRLRFTGEELRELISQRYAGPEYFYDSFYRELISLTGGHVGALCDLVTVIVAVAFSHIAGSKVLASVIPKPSF
jgi:hypothetical protein